MQGLVFFRFCAFRFWDFRFWKFSFWEFSFGIFSACCQALGVYGLILRPPSQGFRKLPRGAAK